MGNRGTRVLRLDLTKFIMLMRWPFDDPKAAFSIVANRLPIDCEFVKIYKTDGHYVYVLLASEQWQGDITDTLLEPPVFAMHGEAPKVTITTPPLPRIYTPRKI